MLTALVVSQWFEPNVKMLHHSDASHKNQSNTLCTLILQTENETKYPLVNLLIHNRYVMYMSYIFYVELICGQQLAGAKKVQINLQF